MLKNVKAVSNSPRLRLKFFSSLMKTIHTQIFLYIIVLFHDNCFLCKVNLGKKYAFFKMVFLRII